MMPHVDDGTLHALLDGALRAESPARAEEVEAHLEGCADCRARLEHAAGLRDRAGRILDDIAPAAAPAIPDFAEVLARAGGPVSGGPEAGAAAPTAGTRGSTAARRLRRTRGVAWAATIVLALGTGYLIRDLVGPAAPASDASVATAPAVREPGSQADAGGEAAGQAAPPPPTAAAEAPAADVSPMARDEDDAARGLAAAEAAVRAEQAAKATEGDRSLEPAGQRSAPALAAPPPAAGAAPEAERARSDFAAEPLYSSAAGRQTVRGVTGAGLSPERQEGRWVAATPDQAAAALGGRLYVLPRAELVEVYRSSEPGTPGAFTLQRLSSGLVLRVVQRPVSGDVAEEMEAKAPATSEAAADSGAASLPDAATVRVPRDGFVLEITGSLPAELLVILGEGARPAP